VPSALPPGSFTLQRGSTSRQMTQLEERSAGRRFDVEQRQASVDQLKAQLTGAKWNLDKTECARPADGYVTNVALRKGARVANLPLTSVMAFIDTADTLIGTLK
jgi:multidrug resistance efflux pump